jgi:hypothetical protein
MIWTSSRVAGGGAGWSASCAARSNARSTHSPITISASAAASRTASRVDSCTPLMVQLVPALPGFQADDAMLAFLSDCPLQARRQSGVKLSGAFCHKSCI